MDGIDYNEVFGIESENAQEVAEPAETEDLAGANEQEVADPVDEMTESEGAESSDGAVEKAPQSQEMNAAYAAMRRRAEEEAQRKAQAEVDGIFKAAGMRNPYTQRPITNKAEFEEYKKRYDEEQLQKVKSASGMTEEKFNEFVEKLPQVQNARRSEAQAQEVIRQAQAQEAKLAAENGIRAIQQYDPSIKTVQDLAKMPEYAKFYAYVQKGLDFEEAYLLTNRSQIAQNNAAAARQAALNAQSKSHMMPTVARGGASLPEVPADVYEQYRLLNPKATKAEIQRHWAASHKK